MRRNIVIATVAGAALIAGGTATAFALSGDGEGRSEAAAGTRFAQEDDGDGDRPAGGTPRVLAPEAASAALKAAPGTVTGIDLDDDDRSGPVWEVDVLGKDGKWHDVTVDAGSGKVLGQHVDHEDDGEHGQDRVRAELRGATVNAAEAARKVAGSYGTVVSVDLEDEHRSAAVWEVETVSSKDAKEHRVYVAPKDGAVTAAPADDHDDDDHGDDD
ncbi:PepSY domain-containing protein [Streptomyces sp. NPDC003077]|uniref:PepSY domain-containing protein n=1 Tax=Streptomyces sp. NPDC003077 TaxID=3154443 RepID=UPI0033B7035F